MDTITVAAAILLLCSSTMVDAHAHASTTTDTNLDAHAHASTTTGTNPSNPAVNNLEERFHVPQNKRCAFQRALCVAQCTKGSGPGKPDPPEDEECNKSCMKEITCNPDGSTRTGGNLNGFGNAGAGQFGDNKSFWKKLLCAAERAICLISCGGGGSPHPEMPAPYFFRPRCMATCSEDVMCH